jgi:VanZ family protein
MIHSPPARRTEVSLSSRLKSWLPPIIYMAVIFGFSSESNPLPEVTAAVWDKLLHMTEYAGLAVLIGRALRREGFSLLAVIVTAVLFTSFYGGTDEFHQWFVPGRSSDVSDWTADTLGATAGAVAYVTAVRRR